jgi:AraC-like DNA-binding protein
MVVSDILRKLDIVPLSVALGEVVLTKELDDTRQNDFKKALQAVGLERIDNKRGRLIEQVKRTIIELVHRDNNGLKTNLSDYISAKMHHDYTYISNLFSEVESTTIEKYFIAQKIERVKELLVYDELNLNEIADMLNYSSTAYLSTQFKKVTGLTPSYFKQIKEKKRNPLDEV